MEPAPGSLIGAVLDGRYQVLEAVAEGAMGVVYRAERVKLGRVVAIKVLHDELPSELASRKRFEIEAMAMAKLEHPHCAAVLDVGVHDDKPFVVMDFVSGQNLKELIAQGPVAMARAAEIVRQTLSGLAHAHELGIVHRDIKPANIVLSQKAGLGDHVKILDFGLARLSQETSNLTTGIVVGTPSYMAPEQIRGVAIDKRADLYACGVLLFELLTAKKPFFSAKDDPVEVCSMHLKVKPPTLASMLPGVAFGELEVVVAKALAKSPDDRYASAEDMAAALAAAIGRGGVLTPAVGVPVQASAGAPVPSGAPVQAPAGAPVPSGAPAPGPAVPDAAAAHLAASGPASAPGAPAASVPASAEDPARAAAAPTASAPAGPAAGGLAQSPAAPVVPAPAGDLARSPSAPAAPAPAGGLAPAPAAPAPVFGGPAPGEPRPFPFTTRQVAIGAGAVIVLIVVIAVVASRGGQTAASTPPPADAATAPAPAVVDPGDPVGDVLSRANELVANGRREAALDLLSGARKMFPDDARVAYLMGKLYFTKLWYTDGLKHLRDAVRLDPTYKTDDELIKTVLKAFNTTPRYDAQLAAFLREHIGPPAKPYLEETAQSHPNPSIRARAASELRRY